MRELSLFSGAGGGLLGSILLGWDLIGCVEIDDYCQRVLRARMDDGYLPEAPIFGDIRQFIESGCAREYRGVADVVTAGFPCQPFSVAGRRAGEDDERNMWPATAEVLRLVRPRFAFLENVPGLLAHRYFGRILGDLATLGYVVRWTVLGADDVGAPHRRKRLWIAADRNADGREQEAVKGFRERSDSNPCGNGDAPDSECDQLRNQSRRLGRTSRTGASEPRDDGPERSVADANDQRQLQQEGTQPSKRRRPSYSSEEMAEPSGARLSHRRRPEERRRAESSARDWWGPEPDVGRVADGVASRVGKLRALGNRQVPAVARAAWELLSDC